MSKGAGTEWANVKLGNKIRITLNYLNHIIQFLEFRFKLYKTLIAVNITKMYNLKKL